MIATRPVLDAASLKVANPEAELRYKFCGGLELCYRSTLSIFRSSDAAPRFSSKSKEEFASDVRLKVIAHDTEDDGYFILAYHTPVEHSIDGQAAPVGPPRIIYYKHTPLGQMLEASDPNEASTLLLPEPAVGAGSEWNVTQLHLAPGRSDASEVASHYRVSAQEGSRVDLVFVAQELRYQGQVAGTEGNVYTVSGKGKFSFDSEAGRLLRLETESVMTSKEDDLLLEVVALHVMELQKVLEPDEDEE